VALTSSAWLMANLASPAMSLRALRLSLKAATTFSRVAVVLICQKEGGRKSPVLRSHSIGPERHHEGRGLAVSN